MATNPPIFPSVGLLSPVDNPNYIPGSPHNLPPRRDRPNIRGYIGVPGQSLVTDRRSGDGPTVGGASGGPLSGYGAEPFFNPHAYAQVIEGTFVVTLASQKFLDQPDSWRNILMIRNSSAAANIYVSFGRDASVTGSIIRLSSNQILLFDTVVPQDDLYVIGDAAGSIAYGYSTIVL